MSRKKQRVLLGMSGGVDSSVAGYLLREQGYEVIGVTMKVWPQDCISRAEDKCCGPQAIADARSVAHSLSIPHYVVDEADQFERLVIDYFSSEYQAGRTPNPCVMCNEKLKFGNLWSKAAALGCDYIATGHYAIIEQRADHAILRKGLDPRKDQSYFLFSLRQPQLRRALTPLGKMTKSQIRDIARGFHGGVNSCQPGVARAPLSRRFDVTVKIRYSHPGTRATVTQLEDGRAHVRLHDPQRAVTPGQAAVLYDDDIVLGGGWICRGEPIRHSEPIGRSETFNRSATTALA